MLEDRSSVTGWPASSAARILAADWGSTPTIRTSGRACLSAADTPAISPPPPIGTNTVPRSGTCSSSSSATVPWPAMIIG